MVPSTNYCVSCGESVAPDISPQGFCPRCLLSLGLSHTNHDMEDENAMAPSFAVGARVDGAGGRETRYRILERVSRGGMGVVYRAEDTNLKRQVALKFLAPHLTGEETPRARFVREAQAASALDHPNICGIYQICETAQGDLYIVMPYYKGETLKATLEKEILDRESVLRIAHQVASGLDAAHRQGIVHRDIKPANLMITEDGVVKILDFGLAKLAAERRLTKSGTTMGTLAYMSPEQLRGEHVDQRTDLWSLGGVLYEMVTGRQPFRGQTEYLLTLSVLHDQPDLSGIDPELRQLVGRCLRKDPKSRLVSAAEVRAELPASDVFPGLTGAGVAPMIGLEVPTAGRRGFRTTTALAYSVASLGLLGVVLLLGSRIDILREVGGALPREALTERARGVLGSLGLDPRAGDTREGFVLDFDYLFSWSRRGGPVPESAKRFLVEFWYRRSRSMMRPQLEGSWALRPVSVSPGNPPLTEQGMALVRLDLQGRLIGLRMVPPQRGPPADGAGTVDWTPLIEAAGLSGEHLRPASTSPNTPFYADRQSAWLLDTSDTTAPLRIEMASYRGSPVFFEVSKPNGPRQHDPEPRSDHVFGLHEKPFVVVFFVLLLWSFYMARRNIRLRRWNATVALSLPASLSVLILSGWLLRATHHWNLAYEYRLVISALGATLSLTLFCWLFYIAFEPGVRRRWPEVLLSWTRLAEGRVRDTLVGRDILIGTLLGSSWFLVHELFHLGVFGPPDSRFHLTPNFITLQSLRLQFGALLLVLSSSVLLMLTLVFVLHLLRLLLRHQALVAATALVMLTGMTSVLWSTPAAWISWTVMFSIVLFGILRLGALATVCAYLVYRILWSHAPSFDLSSWYTESSLLAILVVVGLILYGFITSLGGRPILSERFFEA